MGYKNLLYIFLFWQENSSEEANCFNIITTIWQNVFSCKPQLVATEEIHVKKPKGYTGYYKITITI